MKKKTKCLPSCKCYFLRCWWFCFATTDMHQEVSNSKKKHAFFPSFDRVKMDVVFWVTSIVGYLIISLILLPVKSVCWLYAILLCSISVTTIVYSVFYVYCISITIRTFTKKKTKSKKGQRKKKRLFKFLLFSRKSRFSQ